MRRDATWPSGTLFGTSSELSRRIGIEEQIIRGIDELPSARTQWMEKKNVERQPTHSGSRIHKKINFLTFGIFFFLIYIDFQMSTSKMKKLIKHIMVILNETGTKS